MKNFCSLFVCVVLIIPVLCYASDWDLDADGDVDGKDVYLLTGAFSSDHLEPFAAVFGSVETTCGAYVAPGGVWKEFDCYNLAAVGRDLGHNPFIPSWSLIGGYWQWGRKGPDPSDWHDINTEHFAHGPTGPGDGETNEGEISGWDQTNAPDGAWSGNDKTDDDPCLDGFRVPSIAQWMGVITNNIQTTVGTWTNSATNYSSALIFGTELMLPAAGSRYYTSSGALSSRGDNGFYWSGSEYSGTYGAWGMYFSSSNVGAGSGGFRQDGHSVRCVAE